MKYDLRLFDEVLLTFEIEKEELGEQKYHITHIDSNKKNLLPIGFDATDSGIEKWLASRVIPKNREHVEQILTQSGLSRNDTMGIINICKGLSLNDSYWVVEEGFKGKFADYNLYDNNFTRVLALIAYTGYGSQIKKGFTSSPEYTTSGMLKKCWHRINGRIYLYKGGSSGAINTGKEPYSEYYASQIAEAMGLNHVSYNLSKWKGIICSTCELFTNKYVSYVPIYRFLKKASLKSVAEFLKSLGKDIYDEFIDMLIFDSLIFNTDRHFGNFGLLVDNKTNKPISFAPIFDNGLSLFNYAMDNEIDNLDKYSKTRQPAYDGVSYEEIIEQFITERQKKQLKKIINFEFKKHSRYNLSEERLCKIQNFLHMRAQYILTIKK